MGWYNFPKAFIPARVSFKSRPPSNPGCSKANGCGASKYQFVGTNDNVCDQYSAWTVLCEDLSGKDFEFAASESKFCSVASREPFKCLGISVLDSGYKGNSEVSMNG